MNEMEATLRKRFDTYRADELFDAWKVQPGPPDYAAEEHKGREKDFSKETTECYHCTMHTRKNKITIKESCSTSLVFSSIYNIGVRKMVGYYEP